MGTIGMKEYCETIDHWTEMYVGFRECDKFEKSYFNQAVNFFKDGKFFKSVGYGSSHCSYCESVTDRKHPDCFRCVLYDIQCERLTSPWQKFRRKPSSETALEMLTAIVEREPKEQ